MITRSPSLTDQVKAHVKRQILDDRYEGGRMPPESALAEELGVSRTTVRDALSKLEHEGVIYRKQGAGTFVNRAALQITSRLEDIWSYTKVLEDHGYTPSVEVISDRNVAADETVAAALGVAPGAGLVEIEKLFFEDDQPVILTRNRIPAHLVDETAHRRDEVPIYEFLEMYCDRRLAYYVSEIVPVAFDRATAKSLCVRQGTVGLSFVEVGFDQSNEPIVHATSYFRDDLLRFRVIRRRGSA